MVTLKRVGRCDKSRNEEKSDDKSSGKQPEFVVSYDNGDQEDSNDETTDEEEPLNEFEDPLYKMSQSYEMEPEYENMIPEQEVAKVKIMTP